MAVLSEAHDRAERRLSAALAKEHRLTYRYKAAVGTSGEMSANAELRAATAQVAARNAWLECIDTEESHIAPDAGHAAAAQAAAVDAWLMWVDDKSYTGRDAGDVARLRLR